MEWSHYQTDIFNHVEHQQGNSAVIACAGSSKTTVGVKSLELVPSFYQTRFMAFNNTVKQTLIEKTSHIRNVEVVNYNGFGWGICRKAYGFIQLDASGVTKSDDAFKFQCFPNLDNPHDRKAYYSNRYMIRKLVSLCKGHALLTVDQAVAKLDELIDYHAFDVKDQRFKEWFAIVYGNVIVNKKLMDYDDQLFMPIKYDLPIPQTDYLMVDEFQDSNYIQYLLAVNSVKGDKSRIMAIGDPNQSIYGFRGTAPNIIDQFIRENNAKKLPLYICYRCSVAAVLNAQQYVPHIEAWDQAKQGFVDWIRMEDYVKMVTDNDLVLCRTTAPLIKSCLKFIARDIPAYVRGKEIGEGLINLIDKISNENDGLSNIKFNEQMKAYGIEEKAKLEQLDKEVALQLLTDQLEALDAIIPNVSYVADLKRKINSMIIGDKEKKIGIEHLSIHKAKGLETTATGNVFSLPYKPFKLKRTWMMEEERRLRYVEATRSRNNHYYVM